MGLSELTLQVILSHVVSPEEKKLWIKELTSSLMCWLEVIPNFYFKRVNEFPYKCSKAQKGIFRTMGILEVFCRLCKSKQDVSSRIHCSLYLDWKK